MPPLPAGNFVDDAKQGDRRYASPVEPAAPAPPSQGTTETSDEVEKDSGKTVGAAAVGAGILAGGAAIAGTARPTSAPEREPATRLPEPKPAPAPIPKPEPTVTPAAVASASKPVIEPAGPRTVHARDHDNDNDDEPVWQRWLPFGAVAGAGVLWLAIMAMMGQGQVDETSPPRVIEQASRITSEAQPPVNSTPPTHVVPATENAAPGTSDDGAPKPNTPGADNKLPANKVKPVGKNAKPAANQPKANAKDAAEKASTKPNAAKSTPKNSEAKTAPGAETASAAETKPETKKPKPAASKPAATAATPSATPAKTEPTPKPQPQKDTANSGIAKPAEKPAQPTTTADTAALADTLRPTLGAAQTATSPTSPAKKPAALTATPGASPRIKPPSINRSIERLGGRSLQTRAASSAPPLTQQYVGGASVRSSAAYTNTAASAPYRPLTAVELLQDNAAEGARTLSTPSATSRFNADVKRALQSGADGSAQPLTTPDGRLLALRIITTRENQIRSMSIPRSPLVVKPSTRMVLEGGLYRTREQVKLRAGPSEGASIQLLARGVLLESIGTMGNSEWKLVGQQGRALGYVKASELQLATDAMGGTSVSDAAKTVLFDVAQVRTRCRDAQYAIDGGGSGAFTACRVYGGEWVLERSGDVAALSPGRLVFQR